MLEAAGIQKFDLLSSLIGANLDQECVESGKRPITNVFTKYVDVVNQVSGGSRREK